MPIGGSADAEDVARVSVRDLSPPRRAWPSPPAAVGCEARGKAQGPLRRPGSTGQGKAGQGVNASEPSLMTR